MLWGDSLRDRPSPPSLPHLTGPLCELSRLRASLLLLQQTVVVLVPELCVVCTIYTEYTALRDMTVVDRILPDHLVLPGES